VREGGEEEDEDVDEKTDGSMGGGSCFFTQRDTEPNTHQTDTQPRGKSRKGGLLVWSSGGKTVDDRLGPGARERPSLACGEH
jgi:hypothetical protein